MDKYYLVKVEFKVENDKGKIKKERYSYLVLTTGCTEAEAKITAYLVEQGENEFKITASAETKITAVL